MTSRALKFSRGLMVAKKPVPLVPEPAYRRIECSYQSNLWVATLPLEPEEEDTLHIKEDDDRFASKFAKVFLSTKFQK